MGEILIFYCLLTINIISLSLADHIKSLPSRIWPPGHRLYRPVLTPRDPYVFFWILQVNLRYMTHDVKSSGFGNLQLLMTVALHWGFPSACVLVSCAALRQTAAASTEPGPWKQPSCGLERRSLALSAAPTGGGGGTGCQRWCEIPLGSHPPTWRPAAAASAAASRIPPTPPDQTSRQEVKPVTFLSISQLNLTNPSGLWNHVSTSLCEHWAATLSGIRDCLTESFVIWKEIWKILVWFGVMLLIWKH